MGKTAIMKIMERASGREVQVGERIWCKVDLASARDFGGANCVLQFEKEMGKDAKVWDPDKIAYTFDLQAPSHSEKVSNNQKIIREFAKRQGIQNVFDINHGIGQHVMLEAGLIKPGDVVLGTDSHMNLLGAVGAFATGVGNSDIAASYINGTSWFRVPETMKIEVEGEFKPGVCMRDLLTKIVGDLGAGGMDFLAVEFVGADHPLLHGDGNERKGAAYHAKRRGSRLALRPRRRGSADAGERAFGRPGRRILQGASL